MEASVVGDIDTQQELGGVINVVFRFQDGKEVLERELSVRWVKQGPVANKDRSGRKGDDVRMAWIRVVVLIDWSVIVRKPYVYTVKL